MEPFYGSEKVRQLLGQWEGQAKKIENADRVIQLLDQVSNPSPGLDAEAHKEQLALPGYKDALFKAEDVIREQMSRELVSDEPSALTGKLGQSVNQQVDLGTF